MTLLAARLASPRCLLARPCYADERIGLWHHFSQMDCFHCYHVIMTLQPTATTIEATEPPTPLEDDATDTLICHRRSPPAPAPVFPLREYHQFVHKFQQVCFSRGQNEQLVVQLTELLHQLILVEVQLQLQLQRQ